MCIVHNKDGRVRPALEREHEMKRLLITAAALTLLGAPVAFADPQDDHHDHKATTGQSGQGAHGSAGGQGAHGSAGGAGGPGGSGGHSTTGGGGGSGPTHFTTSNNVVTNSGSNGNGGRQWNGVAAGHVAEVQTSQGQGQSSHGGQSFRGGSSSGAGQTQGHGSQGAGRGQGSGRYLSFQRNTTAQHHFRAGGFRWPQGLSYRRYSYGEFLPQIFFGQDYWLYDYSDYGLPYPPPGAAWVRYGPDALLIDRYSGEIIQVVYGVFY